MNRQEEEQQERRSIEFQNEKYKWTERVSPEQYQRGWDLFQEYNDKLLEICLMEGVTGVSVGMKRDEFDHYTQELCFIVYTNDREKQFSHIPTQLGPLSVQRLFARFKETSSIGSLVHKSGTLGCFLEDEENKHYFFTCAHVVSDWKIDEAKKTATRHIESVIDDDYKLAWHWYGPLKNDRNEVPLRICIDDQRKYDLINEESKDGLSFSYKLSLVEHARDTPDSTPFADFALYHVPRPCKNRISEEYLDGINKKRLRRDQQIPKWTVESFIPRRADIGELKIQDKDYYLYGFGAETMDHKDPCFVHDFLNINNNKYKNPIWPIHYWPSISGYANINVLVTGAVQITPHPVPRGGDSGTAIWMDKHLPNDQDKKNDPILVGIFTAGSETKSMFLPLHPIIEMMNQKLNKKFRVIVD